MERISCVGLRRQFVSNRRVEFSPPPLMCKKVATDKSSLLIQAISNQNMKAKATWTGLKVGIVEPTRNN